MWHTDEKTGPDGVKHSHPLAWATNKSGHGKVDYIADSGLQIPDSVENAEDDSKLALEEANKILFTNSDVLICIAASGNTPFTCSFLVSAARIIVGESMSSSLN